MAKKELYKINDIIEGVVISIRKYGVFLSFDEGYVGLLHISEISTNFVNNINRYFHLGDKVKVLVKEIDLETKFLKVSLKLLPVELNPYSKILPSKKITSYLRDIDFTKLEKALPKMIKEELDREKIEEGKIDLWLKLVLIM